MPTPLTSLPNYKGDGPKFTDTQREAVKAKVADLDAKGYSQTSIGRIVGVNQSQVSMYLKSIREGWVESQKTSRGEAVARKIAQYEKIREEAWEAYERSKDNTNKEVDELIPSLEGLKGNKGNRGSMISSMVLINKVRTVEGRLPANEYLSTIMKTLEAERQLLGLDESPPAGDINVGVQVNGVSDGHTQQQLTLRAILDAAKNQMDIGRPQVAQPVKEISDGR